MFAADDHVEVEATWGIYQRMIAAYRHEDRRRGRELMVTLIETVTYGVPAVLTELVTLGRTLKQRADDVLAYFDRPGTSNGPTEAINGRLEHLRQAFDLPLAWGTLSDEHTSLNQRISRPAPSAILDRVPEPAIPTLGISKVLPPS